MQYVMKLIILCTIAVITQEKKIKNIKETGENTNITQYSCELAYKKKQRFRELISYIYT